ncbi:hypothetical protein Pen01_33820 [Phytomonospora endophytica]|nr:hypothetical protein Pen01_33820 [Phytomonospora endophytica]
MHRGHGEDLKAIPPLLDQRALERGDLLELGDVTAGKGVIFKRCGCRSAAPGKRLKRKCPRPSGHGIWYFHCPVVAALMVFREERTPRCLVAGDIAAPRVLVGNRTGDHPVVVLRGREPTRPTPHGTTHI